jgi:hypothetical protein
MTSWWKPTDPFSGTTITHNYSTEGGVASKLDDHAASVQTHGTTLTAHTQGPVGHGELGTVANGFVQRIVGALGEGFTGALGGFYQDTAKIARNNTQRIKDIEAETKSRHDSIGKNGHEPSLGGPVDSLGHHLGLDPATPVGSSTVGKILANVDAAKMDPNIGHMFTRYNPFPISPQKLNELYDKTKYGGRGGWDYPKNGGAVAGTEHTVELQPGTMLSRVGSDDGTYFTTPETGYGERGLPPDSLGTEAEGFKHTSWEVVEPISGTMSTVAPAFGQPGGGPQFVTKESAKKLERKGSLRRRP